MLHDKTGVNDFKQNNKAEKSCATILRVAYLQYNLDINLMSQGILRRPRLISVGSGNRLI